jgi:glyoxylase-like metal-dependent hydrolase (beta-lactamase superfamily II)/rhodanese-related sulfurtransferase
MDVHLFHDAGLGNGSYLIEIGAGRAALVDPDRRFRRYLEEAERREVEIAMVLDTHLHADFVSGAHDLHAETGAELYEPAEAGLSSPHRGVKPDERLAFGDVEVEVVGSPGHAPEHVSYVVRRDGDPTPVLFSGGALIVGGAARTDLAGAELTERLTRQAFETLRHAFEDLPDESLLMPTHGAGSFCSTGGGRAEHTSTLGAERTTNPLLAMREEAFLRDWPPTFPRTPTYFARMRELNRSGPRLRSDVEPPRPLDPKAFASAASQPHTIVLDLRGKEAYGEAHVEGALAIPFRDSFPTWAGWLVPPETGLLFVLDRVPVDDAVDACLLVGLERFEGSLEGGIEAWQEAGLPVRSLPGIVAEDAVPWIEAGARALDVREPDELERGRIAGAVAIPLGDLARAIDRVPMGRPLLTYCASGMRSTTAASILERAGVGPVVNLRGGYGAWQEAGRD